MQAICYDTYGPPTQVLKLRDDVKKPAPGRGEVLIRVHASSINRGDYYTVVGYPRLFRPAYGWPRPRFRVPGRDVAGVIEAIGEDAENFSVGGAVIGELEGGGYGEYCVAPVGRLAHKPSALSFSVGATIPLAGCAAFQAMKAGGVRDGSLVLINGASGNLGTFAVSIAKAMGADVTAVCHTRNVQQAKDLGADRVIDYTETSVVDLNERFDVAFDVVGNHSPSAMRRLVHESGTLLSSSSNLSYLLRCFLTFGKPKVSVFAASPNTDDLVKLARWVADGVVVPAIENEVPLRELPRALQAHGEGHSRGKTVIKIC